MVSLGGRTPETKQNGRWTEEEHLKFQQAVELYGKKWKKIEAIVGTRTATQIRSHAQKHFIRLKKSFHNDSDEPSSVSEGGSEKPETELSEEMSAEVEKMHLKSYIHYIEQVNAQLQDEIKKCQKSDQPCVILTPQTDDSSVVAPPQKLESLASSGSAFKPVKMGEEKDFAVVNSSNASEEI